MTPQDRENARVMLLLLGGFFTGGGLAAVFSPILWLRVVGLASLWLAVLAFGLCMGSLTYERHLSRRPPFPPSEFL